MKTSNLIAENAGINEKQSYYYATQVSGILYSDLNLQPQDQSEWVKPLKRIKADNSFKNSPDEKPKESTEGVEYNGSTIDYAYRKLFGYSFSALLTRAMKLYPKQKNSKQKQLIARFG